MSVVLLPWPAPVHREPNGESTGHRVEALLAGLTSLGRVLVAFSGGADSAFLLAAAARVLGPGSVTAATAVSDSLPATELAAAAAFAAGLGVVHLRPPTHELDRPGYRANDGDRCYHCKAELLDVLTPLAVERGAVVVTGTNADDVAAGFRPGIRAGFERGAHTPLADAGLRKAEIRAVSRDWGLVTAEKPAAACLSSRVAYGIAIDPARLARVDAAEQCVRDLLRAAGLAVGDLRVRDLGDHASVEIDPAQVEAAAGVPGLLEAVRGCGFAAAVLDPRGFRSGAMNERLAQPDRWR